METRIDCIVVGYNDAKFADLLQRNEWSRDFSGGYRHLLVNSVSFHNERLSYIELLNRVIESATEKPSKLHVAKLPNLGVCYLVSFLRRRSFRAELINFYNDEKEEFRTLLRQRPRAVAITTTFYYEAPPIQEIVAFIRQHSPETKVIVGGPHIFNICSDHPPLTRDAFLREIGADIYVFDSQGEATLARICAELRELSPDLSRIPNLIYAVDEKSFQQTVRQVEANDMDAEAVDWSLFDPHFIRPTVQTRTARSCAFKCAFCRYPVVGGPLNLTSLSVVERELQYLKSIGVSRLLFIDDTFNIPLRRFKDLCRMMIRNKFGIEWFSYFRCANADIESFDLMAEAGCKGVFLGIESGDDEVLKAMNKSASSEKYAKAIGQLNLRQIITYASFIIGHPGETEESARRSLEFIEATSPSFYCLETFFYDPKVPIGARANEFELSGSAYSWKHRTMNWQYASDIVEDGYRTISNSVICPLYGFDLWSVAYLLGQQLSIDQIRKFLIAAGRLLNQTGQNDTVPALEDALVDVFRDKQGKVPPSVAATEVHLAAGKPAIN